MTSKTEANEAEAIANSVRDLLGHGAAPMSYTIWPDGYVGDALQDVYNERLRQDDLEAEGLISKGLAGGKGSRAFNHFKRYSVLGEEVGEVGHELNESIGPKDLDLKQLRTELIQVAAVAVAWVEAIDKEIDACLAKV